ncbi:hypothetical protein ACFFX0_19695 [Citricoccus parietis]|uniref:Uncharacterized protein n=1 Tax=Citricoccus parietis TaxID=592307 RepID=A0ABV5G2Y6_9MICC
MPGATRTSSPRWAMRASARELRPPSCSSARSRSSDSMVVDRIVPSWRSATGRGGGAVRTVDKQPPTPRGHCPRGSHGGNVLWM